MRLLCIAILSVFLFFVIFIALHPLFGPNSAWVAAFMMYIGFPILFLRYWNEEWEGPVVRAGNYLIALVVFSMSAWFAYITFSEGTDQLNAIMFFLVYGYGAIHYLAFGRLHFKLRNNNET